MTLMKVLQDVFWEAPSTNTVAAGAVTSPFWVHFLDSSSDIGTKLLPLLGCTWLIVQMVSHFRKKK